MFFSFHICRTPHGVRGLKLEDAGSVCERHASHPSRGAWIEIRETNLSRGTQASRTPHGVRGLKYPSIMRDAPMPGRTPHGVRGLKSRGAMGRGLERLSHPSRGAWIEISSVCWRAYQDTLSHPSRGAWIEITAPPGGWSGVERRTPHGVRGLKCCHSKHDAFGRCRTPHGVRGLK